MLRARLAANARELTAIAKQVETNAPELSGLRQKMQNGFAGLKDKIKKEMKEEIMSLSEEVGQNLAEINTVVQIQNHSLRRPTGWSLRTGE